MKNTKLHKSALENKKAQTADLRISDSVHSVKGT